ncbi:MAG: glycosyltransferase, partial [Alphaproteobacteria bacterium]|nr:glycosyltransferase [Alphaproteobacteria bacterium]
MAPKISVVIPVFNNRLNEVQNAIASVIAQTHQNFEIIVVNDCSDDNGQTIADVNGCIAKYPAHTISLITHDNNQGVSAARNTGIKKVSGEFIATLDSDDIWHPEKLAAQLQAIEQSGDRENTICLCDYDSVPKNGQGVVIQNRPSY